MKGKDKVEDLNTLLADEKSPKESAEAESLKYQKIVLVKHNNGFLKAFRQAEFFF